MTGFIFLVRIRSALAMAVCLVCLLVLPVPSNASARVLNILFIGADKDELLMTAIYHIDVTAGKDALGSEAVFFPSTAVVSLGSAATLAEIFEKGDADGLLRSLEQTLKVDIAYYIRIERQALEEAEGFIDPITVAGETVALEDLFTMAIGPHDKEILGQLMNRFTRPHVYFFHLPRLVFSPKKLVQTDFAPTAANLWFHFKIATRVDTRNVKKTVITSSPLTAGAWRFGG